jgi:hypothetical protein
MQESGIDRQKTRSDLKAKRNLLFACFSRNPSDTRLALEIRLLDDRISDLEGTEPKKSGQAVRHLGLRGEA